MLVESLVLSVVKEPSSELLKREELSLEESVLGRTVSPNRRKGKALKGSSPLSCPNDEPPWKPGAFGVLLLIFFTRIALLTELGARGEHLMEFIIRILVGI